MSMSEKQRFEQLKAAHTVNGQLIYAGTLLARAAQQWPYACALETLHETISFQELHRRANALSKELEKQNIGIHNKVMVLYENISDFYVAYYGGWQTGAIIIPVSTFLSDKEFEHIIQDAQPSVILVSQKLEEKLRALSLTLPPLITQQTLQEWYKNAPLSVTYTVKERDRNDLCVLLYTSGTTGLPKGVMLSSNNIIINCLQGAARFDYNEHERIFCALPLFHSFTQNSCVWVNMLLGACVILVPRIDRASLLAGLAKEPTAMLGIPGLYALFCRLKHASFDHVRYFVCGGDALPDKIRLYFEALFGRKLCNGYGLSETAPLIAVDIDDTVSSTHTVGKACEDVNIELRDKDPHSGIGVLWVKGPNIMLGYYNAPEATAKVLIDGWLNTGDFAQLDEQGKLVICGREKDLIIHKGINIYPQEVENVLMSHPDVTMAAVIGEKEHDIEYPVAYVMPKDETLSPNALKEFCKNQLASYKVPRKIIIQKTLPLTATGKINKKELRTFHTSV